MHDKQKYTLRFYAKDIREILKKYAERNRRSLNAELLCLIEAGFKTVYGIKLESTYEKAPVVTATEA